MPRRLALQRRTGGTWAGTEALMDPFPHANRWGSLECLSTAPLSSMCASSKGKSRRAHTLHLQFRFLFSTSCQGVNAVAMSGIGCAHRVGLPFPYVCSFPMPSDSGSVGQGMQSDGDKWDSDLPPRGSCSKGPVRKTCSVGLAAEVMVDLGHLPALPRPVDDAYTSTLQFFRDRA
eukprot:scaffold83094_cov19-Tisochrysis_lutea.AAC.3